jgi:glutamate-1-semialdehyde aminotransferase
MAQRLKDGLNEAFIKNEVPGHARGLASIVQLVMGVDCDCDRELCTMPYEDIYRWTAFERTRPFRQAMVVNGVDLMGAMGGPTFMVSSAHDEDIIDRTLEAFTQSIKDLRAEGAL